MSILFDVRNRLSGLNISELHVTDDQPALVNMLKEIQVFKLEMNQAIMKAIDEVADSYKPRLDELEKRYAFLLRMSA